LASGSFSNNTGSLEYLISGLAESAGIASFTINVSDHSCPLNLSVSLPVCRAKISSTEYKNFMCHNLGVANTNSNPFVPSWEITGGYWQWGRKDQAASGPSGPDASQANSGAVGGWNTKCPQLFMDR
jgi:hypothetical protein